MDQQQDSNNTQAAQSDPMLRLAELLVKINKREKVVEDPTEGLFDEASKRSPDSTS